MATQLVDASANAFLTDVVSQAQAVSALNGQVLLQLRGQSTCSIQVSAIGTQTLVFEGTTDGTNFYALTVFPIGGFTGAPITSTTATGQWIVVCAGMYQIRTRCSAYTSGTATISMVASQGTNEQQVTTGIAQSSVSASQLGQIVMGNVTTAAPSYTTAQSNPLSLTVGGGLRIALAGNAGAFLDAAAPGTIPNNALLIGARAANANPTSATNGQMQAPLCDLSGRLITTPLNYRTLIKHQATATSLATEVSIITAQGANVFADLLTLIVTTAVATAGTLTIRDVTAGGTPWIVNYPNAAVAPGSPLIISFPCAPLQQGTANSAWTITNSQAVAINVTAQFVNRLA